MTQPTFLWREFSGIFLKPSEKALRWPCKRWASDRRDVREGDTIRLTPQMYQGEVHG
jgi:hypothetical protein